MKPHIVIAVVACMVAVLLVYMQVHVIGAPVNDHIKDRVRLQTLMDCEDQSQLAFCECRLLDTKGFAVNRSGAGINNKISARQLGAIILQ